jgi:hypothetical protein
MEARATGVHAASTVRTISGVLDIIPVHREIFSVFVNRDPIGGEDTDRRRS